MSKCLLAIVILSANLLLTGCADDQARAQLADTNTRLSLLEQNVGLLGNKVSNQKGLDLLNKLDELQSQVDQLNGIVSTLKQNQQTYQTTQDQINRGLQDQIQPNVTGATPSVATTAKSDEGGDSDTVDNADSISNNKNIPQNVSQDKAKTQDKAKVDKDKLDAALKRLKAHDFNNAIKQFKSIIDTSKDVQVSSTASYYLAVAYVANKQYKNAIAVARKFVTANPDNSNAPDALRIVYISQTELGMTKAAANTANSLLKTYPNSDAAKKLQQ
jgi:TolA-binding protein